MLAFKRHFTDNSVTLFVSSGGTSTPLAMADGSGPFGGLADPHINAGGEVAFQGYVFQPVEGYGIFTGPDPAADKVIQTGDALFGSSVTFVDLSLGRRLNDRGDIAFGYVLANGIAGIAVARLSLPGDYNASGTVDDADYVVLAQGGPTDFLPNDLTPGIVNASDYNVWRANFGQLAGSGSGSAEALPSQAAIPEPATLVLMTSAAANWCLRRRRAA